MKQLTCVSFEQEGSLKIQEVDAPPLAPHQVRIKVTAAGIGYVDALIVKGLYQIKPPLPFVPGSEIAGVVMEVGSQVNHLKPGQRVAALGFNALAEQAVAPARTCIPIPDSMSDTFAGGLMTGYGTTIYALENCGNITAGETILILGAAGGVGLATIDVAKALGARVIAAASTESKRQTCLDAGADAVIDYTAPNWRDELKKLTADSGLDIVYDIVGGEATETALRSLSPGGRLLIIGFASGDIPSIPMNLPLLKRCSIVGVNFGGNLEANPEIFPSLIGRLMELYNTGKLKAQEPLTFPLADTPLAFQKILARETIGKVVIEPQR